MSYSGTTTECLREYGQLHPNSASRKLLAKFAQVDHPSVRDWLSGTRPPVGETLVRVRCFLHLAGLTVTEFESLLLPVQKFALLMALDVVSFEEAQTSLKYKDRGGLLGVVLRGTIPTADKVRVLERLILDHAVELEHAIKTWQAKINEPESSDNGSLPSAPVSPPSKNHIGLVTMSGSTQVCLADFRTRFLDRKGRKLLMRFAQVNDRTVRRWYSGFLPQGITLLRLRCCLFLIGYDVKEFKSLPPVAKQLALLIALDIVTVEEAQLRMEYSRLSSIYDTLIRGTMLSNEKLSIMAILVAENQVELDARVYDWKQEIILLSRATEDDPPLSSEATTSTVNPEPQPDDIDQQSIPLEPRQLEATTPAPVPPPLPEFGSEIVEVVTSSTPPPLRSRPVPTPPVSRPTPVVMSSSKRERKRNRPSRENLAEPSSLETPSSDRADSRERRQAKLDAANVPANIRIASVLMHEVQAMELIIGGLDEAAYVELQDLVSRRLSIAKTKVVLDFLTTLPPRS